MDIHNWNEWSDMTQGVWKTLLDRFEKKYGRKQHWKQSKEVVESMIPLLETGWDKTIRKNIDMSVKTGANVVSFVRKVEDKQRISLKVTKGENEYLYELVL